MKINGNLQIVGGGLIQNFRLEQLAQEPENPLDRAGWVSADNKFKMKLGENIVSFASEAQVSSVSDTVSAALGAAGLQGNGSLAAFTGTNFLDGSTSLRAALIALDTQAQTNSEAISTKLSRSGGTITGNLVVDADLSLTADRTLTILKTPESATDAVNRAYVDSIAAGLHWQSPVADRVALLSEVLDPVVGMRVINTTDNKIYTYLSSSEFDTGVDPQANWSVFVESNDEGYTFNAEADEGAGAWVKFTRTNAINDGAGLIQVGNVLNVGQGTGIKVNADSIEVDTEWSDGRYIQKAGDSLDGALILHADPSDNLEAVTKQYADAITTRLEDCFYMYTSNAPSTSHTIPHNLGQKYVQVQVVDMTDLQIIPDTVSYTDTNELVVSFSSSVDCRVIVTGLKAA